MNTKGLWAALMLAAAVGAGPAHAAGDPSTPGEPMPGYSHSDESRDQGVPSDDANSRSKVEQRRHKRARHPEPRPDTPSRTEPSRESSEQLPQKTVEPGDRESPSAAPSRHDRVTQPPASQGDSVKDSERGSYK